MTVTMETLLVGDLIRVVHNETGNQVLYKVMKDQGEGEYKVAPITNDGVRLAQSSVVILSEEFTVLEVLRAK